MGPSKAESGMIEQVPIGQHHKGDDRRMCRHYWVIEAADGPISRGVCQRCHVIGEFKNYIDVSSRDDESLLVPAEGPDL